MPKHQPEVPEVVEELYHVLAGIENDTATEACLMVLGDLLGPELTYEDLRHLIDGARKSQEYV